MILVSRPSHHAATEWVPAMTDGIAVLPGLPAVCGKPVHVAADGGRLTADAGVLLLALPIHIYESPTGLPVVAS